MHQNDNAPTHRSCTVANFLQDQGFQYLPWPSFSPDMNPIWNKWVEVTHGINNQAQQPTNMYELPQTDMDMWDDIPLNTLIILSEGIPCHVMALRAAWGGHAREWTFMVLDKMMMFNIVRFHVSAVACCWDILFENVNYESVVSTILRWVFFALDHIVCQIEHTRYRMH